jgi:DNA-binding winged helix-turn-helix (wHTH) protein
MPRLQTPFVINKRFIVNPALNSLLDQETNKELRIEPRLMDVLCFLAASQNQLVTREQMIQELWNDYGGADEGLNQAISFLRKILGDNTKKIIETIPKRGYILHASITEETGIQVPIGKISAVHKNSRKNIYRIVGLLLITIAVIVLINKRKENTSGPDAPASQSVPAVDRLENPDTTSILKRETTGSDVLPTNRPGNKSNEKKSIDSVGADVLLKKE